MLIVENLVSENKMFAKNFGAIKLLTIFVNLSHSLL